MQTKNPFLEEFAKFGEQAMGIAQAAGDEAKTMFRAQGERWATELDLVRRDEMDAQLAALRAEFEARLAALRAELARPPAARPADEVG